MNKIGGRKSRKLHNMLLFVAVISFELFRFRILSKVHPNFLRRTGTRNVIIRGYLQGEKTSLMASADVIKHPAVFDPE